MSNNLKFYKIKLLTEFLKDTATARSQLLDELTVNATDSTIVKRRLRMLRHLSQYEDQIIKKIQDFETDDVEDFNSAKFEIDSVIHRSA